MLNRAVAGTEERTCPAAGHAFSFPPLSHRKIGGFQRFHKSIPTDSSL